MMPRSLRVEVPKARDSLAVPLYRAEATQYMLPPQFPARNLRGEAGISHLPAPCWDRMGLVLPPGDSGPLGGWKSPLAQIRGVFARKILKF